MVKTIYTEISTKKLNIQKAYDFVSDPSHGAIDVFIGTVRNHNSGQKVQKITYDVHEELAKIICHEICKEAQMRWNRVKIYSSHYKGNLDIGEISTIIAVSSAHRDASFETCKYVLEELKKRAPIWKQEHYEHGLSAWLKGYPLQQTVHE